MKIENIDVVMLFFLGIIDNGFYKILNQKGE